MMHSKEGLALASIIVMIVVPCTAVAVLGSAASRRLARKSPDSPFIKPLRFRQAILSLLFASLLLFVMGAIQLSSGSAAWAIAAGCIVFMGIGAAHFLFARHRK